MPYNFETETGTYWGSTFYEGKFLGVGNPVQDLLARSLPEWAFPTPTARAIVLPKIPDLPALPKIDLPAIAGSFAGAGVGSLISTTVGPALMLGLGYLVLKKGKLI